MFTLLDLSPQFNTIVLSLFESLSSHVDMYTHDAKAMVEETAGVSAGIKARALNCTTGSCIFHCRTVAWGPGGRQFHYRITLMKEKNY